MTTAQPDAQVLTGSQFSTYRIGGILDEAYQPKTEEETLSILHRAQQEKKKVTLLGWGGNTIIASRGIRDITLITRKLDWVVPIGNTAFWFGTGVHLAKAANVAMQHSLTGGEFMVGIPGTVGGAVCMNAGALGQETAKVIQRVKLYHTEKQAVEEWSLAELDFQYRKSNIQPGTHVILSALLAFEPGNQAQIAQTMQNSVRFRKEHHPKEPNGGSVFKNPLPDMPVGKLIDELGGKGVWQEGGVMVSPLHGNFIINVDNGSSTDLLKLMLRMKQAIHQHYGLDVFPENLLIGDISPTEEQLWKQLKSPA